MKKRNTAPRKQTAPRKKDNSKTDNLIRLNKYLANAGVCSRREADKLIESGAVKVNGKVVSELGSKVKPTDKVAVGDETLSREKPQYVLLNKPKDFITTANDPQGRKTVMHLVNTACKERIYPVGRLDRMTTGVLLLTNDGELTKKLTHPKHNIKKLYHVQLHKHVSKTDLEQLIAGVQLDDGKATADKASYVEGEDKNQIGVELHSGKNRVVRRMMEALGYKVIKLDRVIFAGLTKKQIPRGKWRHLSEREIGQLKML